MSALELVKKEIVEVTIRRDGYLQVALANNLRADEVMCCLERLRRIRESLEREIIPHVELVKPA